MIFATLLWDANKNSLPFSRMYDESWVEKLYRGVMRNTTKDVTFICFVDRLRTFKEGGINQMLLSAGEKDYGHCIEPYVLGLPMILVGLDTIITGNIDALYDYCCDHKNRIAVPRDPFNKRQVCNGVALVPPGWSHVGIDHNGKENDMEWIRRFNPNVLDDLFPGQVASYKGHVKAAGLGNERIVYFHGEEKPHQLSHLSWVTENWR